MPVGTSGCTYLFTFREGYPPRVDWWAGFLPTEREVKGAHSKSAAGGEGVPWRALPWRVVWCGVVC